MPSLHYCDQRWSWWPRQVVADMGYLASESKRLCRERWGVAVVMHLRSDMKLVAPFVSEREVACAQGQPLQWLSYDARDQQHWFGVLPPAQLCLSCWQASTCPREFAHAPNAHETLLGLLPLNTLAAQRLLQQVRPWIEPAQSYEKNQLGLGQMFFNSLRLTWCMACWLTLPCCCERMRFCMLLRRRAHCFTNSRRSSRNSTLKAVRIETNFCKIAQFSPCPLIKTCNTLS